MVSVEASLYDPGEACWRRTDIELSAEWWAAYGPSDTGSCDDITVGVARIDCSCVVLDSSCGDVSAAESGDPSVDTSASAAGRCAELEAEDKRCP
jgi:hypothetical protein